MTRWRLLSAGLCWRPSARRAGLLWSRDSNHWLHVGVSLPVFVFFRLIFSRPEHAHCRCGFCND